MRRPLASLLVALLSFPLIAQLLLANTASELPTCCLRTGKHHCAGADLNGKAEAPNGPSLQAIQPRCPLFPKGPVVPAFSKSMVPSVGPRALAPHLVGSTGVRLPDDRPRNASRGSVRKRGPPICLNQSHRILL
jgi:hypothetical protein